jgi:hypothetical protein
VWNSLYVCERSPPFTSTRLVDCDLRINFDETNTGSDSVAVIATAPLTIGEKWVELEKGELLVSYRGRVYRSDAQLEKLHAQHEHWAPRCAPCPLSPCNGAAVAAAAAAAAEDEDTPLRPRRSFDAAISNDAALGSGEEKASAARKHRAMSLDMHAYDPPL